MKTKKEWMTGEAFFDYIKHKFYPRFLQKKVKFRIILVLDAYVLHLILSLSKFCRDNGIIIILLLLNTTHVIQPLDLAFFFSLKCGWKVILKEWKKKQRFEVDVQIHYIPKVIDALLKDPSFIYLAHRFQFCALMPFNADAFPYRKLLKHKTLHDNKNVSHLEYLERKIL